MSKKWGFKDKDGKELGVLVYDEDTDYVHFEDEDDDHEDDHDDGDDRDDDHDDDDGGKGGGYDGTLNGKTLVGTTGNDVMAATKDVTKIDALAGFDVLVTQLDGVSKGITLDLGKGTLTNGFGQKVTVSGFEVAFGTDYADKITGGKNDDYLIGGGGNDTIVGGDGFDELYGMDGNDSLSGGVGSDYFVGGKGADRIDGGVGFDTVDYSDEGGTKGIAVNLAKGMIVDTYGDTDKVSTIERVTGSNFADVMVGSNGAEMLDGRGGDDLIQAGTGNDTVAGGAGADKLDGGTGFDTIEYHLESGKLGVVIDIGANSFVDTFGDKDTVVGFERYVGSANGDMMTGGKGNDIFDGWTGNDTLNGAAGNDSLAGGDGYDFLTGGAGVDTIDGGDGIDAVDYRGEDTGKGVVVDMAAGKYQDAYGNLDVVTNVEIVKGTVYADKIAGSDGTDYLDGWFGDDYLFGGAGSDELYGAAGNDTLEGGAGSDYLDGGLGDDLLIGGDRWDFIVLRQDEGNDKVADFDAAIDILDLRNSTWTSVAEARGHMEITNDGTLIHLGTGSMLLAGVFTEIADDRFVL